MAQMFAIPMILLFCLIPAVAGAIYLRHLRIGSALFYHEMTERSRSGAVERPDNSEPRSMESSAEVLRSASQGFGSYHPLPGFPITRASLLPAHRHLR
jgi:hypothetical protein